MSASIARHTISDYNRKNMDLEDTLEISIKELANLARSDDERVASFPPPPLCMANSQNQIRAGDRVIAIPIQSEVVAGRLKELDMKAKRVVIDTGDGGWGEVLSISDLKVIFFPDVREWQPAALRDTGGSIVLPDNDRQDFGVRFIDGDHLKGKTLGYLTDYLGIYLFPACGDGEKKFIYSFIPKEAMEFYTIGPRIGEILQKQAKLSDEQIGKAVKVQQEYRKRPLGAYLQANALVTAKNLEEALSKQKSQPNIRLGELLVQERLLTEEQLAKALFEQSRNKDKPLGEIMVELGFVSYDQIRVAMAKKFGIPIVDLKEFPLDKEVLGLVPEKLVKQYNILPLLQYEGKLAIAIADPLQRLVIETVSFAVNMQVETVIADEAEIARAIKLAYQEGDQVLTNVLNTEKKNRNKNPDRPTMSDNIAVNLVNRIINEAYRQGATDIHIESATGMGKTAVHFRKNGKLVGHTEVPAMYCSAIASRIRFMSGLRVTDTALPRGR